VLVALNPAALVTNLGNLKDGGLIIANADKFTDRDLAKARLEHNPLTDGTVTAYRVVRAPISSMTKEAVSTLGLNAKQADRCKNFFALGMMYWLYSRDTHPTEEWIRNKFKAPFDAANLAALSAGYNYGMTVGLFQDPYHVPKADFERGKYRNIMGNAATAVGLVVAANKSGRPLFYGTYPITPASDILHALAPFKNYGVVTYQAEDEIAGVCSAIGASYGGAIGVTGTSGPGLALKGEALGLAMITELPLVVVNVQRGGPSTGLPTKTEQSDLLQAMYGRNGEAPLPILAPRSPSDCFDVAIEAVRIAVKYMVPVMILSDGYIANGAEPWSIPNLDSIPDIDVTFHTDAEGFQPYSRDEDTLSRPWAIPGTPGLEHRIGGLEKEHLTGNVSYNPENHQMMCELRAEKVQRIQAMIPPTEVFGSDSGLLVLGWGSTYGAIRTAVRSAVEAGQPVAHAHLRHMNPFPPDLGDLMGRYDRVLIPELNLGQLNKLIREQFLLDVDTLHKIQGQPFRTTEIGAKITEILES